MKYLLLFPILFLCTFSLAQSSFVKEVHLAETTFALESQIIGLKQGFLKNLILRQSVSIKRVSLISIEFGMRGPT